MTKEPAKFLSIDQGTTSSRALIFDVTGKTHSISQQEFTQYFPENGWVEHDPEEIWNTTLDCVKDVLENHHDVKGIGITNQRETVIVWEKESGKAIYPAIVWQDRRTADFCEQQKAEGLEDFIIDKTGLMIDPYFSASKIKWILDHVDGARTKAQNGKLLCGTIDCFLLWRLTRGKSHFTDITNASRTNLYNIYDLKWDEDLLKLFDIPAAMLPEVKPNIYDFGEASAGLLKHVNALPILSMAGDQQSAAIAQSCFEKGMVKSTYGTGCFMLMNCGHEPCPSQAKLLTTVVFQIGNRIDFALEGSIFNAGTVVQWLRDEMKLITKASETEEICMKTPSTEGVSFIPAFTGLGAPHWKADARGMIAGLTRGSKPEHIIRAALESIVFQTHDLCTALKKDSGIDITHLRVDGGMVPNNWLCQFLADILNVKIERPRHTELTALGVAQLAALADGSLSSLDDISASWACQRAFETEMKEDQRAAHLDQWASTLSGLTKTSVY